MGSFCLESSWLGTASSSFSSPLPPSLSRVYMARRVSGQELKMTVSALSMTEGIQSSGRGETARRKIKFQGKRINGPRKEKGIQRETTRITMEEKGRLKGTKIN